MKVLSTLLIAVVLGFPWLLGQHVLAIGILELVNPFIGTGKTSSPAPWGPYGGTYPGAVAPFGMVQMTPETSFDPALAGYYYGDNHILCFSIVDHISGYPSGSHGGVCFMPYVGDAGGPMLQSRCSAEVAKPGYYAVTLDDFSIRVELTATERTGMCRLAFSPDVEEVYIRWFNCGQIAFVNADSLGGVWGPFYYWVSFDFPFTSTYKSQDELVLTFNNVEKRSVLLMKVGVSNVSIEAARDNLLTENPGWSFEEIKEVTGKKWARLLGRVEVEGGSTEQQQIFYTALYHAFLVPHVWSDVSGQYRGWDKRVHRCDPGRQVYNRFSPWDTFRTKDPLLYLIDPQTQEDIIYSLLLAYDQCGWLPTGPMTGNHAVAIIVDAYLKGITGFDQEKAYEAMRKSLMEPPFGRRDIAEYLKYGYVPAEKNASVTKTLEYAYNDWVLAQFSKLIGRHEDYKELLSRAYSYKNIFNPETRFMEAKTTKGKWAKGGYEEGDPWTWTCFVPHDVQGLINLMGGREEFSAWLEECFAGDHYVHDNEPPLHYVYLFSFAGGPWRTQKWVREIMAKYYCACPGGLPGNDDLGALSSWFVWSAIGLYPVCPGRDIYVLGSPIFDKVTLHLPGYWGSKTFVIEAKNNGEENRYIQSASLNGRPLERSWIAHQEIINGGYLVLEMGPEPNKELWKSPEAVPPSMTKGSPDFEYGEFTLPSTVNVGETFLVSMTVRNIGSAFGTAIVRLYVDGGLAQTKSIILSPGEEGEVVFEIVSYMPGDHEIQVESLPAKIVRVEVGGLPF